MHHRVLAGNAVHQDVDPAVLAIDPFDQRLDFLLARVIHANGNRGATGAVDQLSGLVDRFRPVVRRRVAAHAAARA